MGGLAGASWEPRIAQAADGAVDAGLLEFLGSVDSDNKDWRDYLAASQRSAGATRNAGPPPPSTPPASSSKPVPAADPPPVAPTNAAAGPTSGNGA